ncbi:hypothetical protein DENIS_1966 [Desulfonema ishimotonii]|uniref:Permuted papain-like amidase YaeF/Yiix C92 family enzyme n=1 Tax=Desulfonema ishimotonii TaxID=45657 RepID=A0A401FVK8_9BACT|nr:hypothetical protein [Desulfonema ishimotonii]GBC61006.1 hypothetical protein DENIS_1966 [Desulfonema ishimotonii]
MAWKSAQYKDVRNDMLPGDIIAFSGKGQFSEIVKWATRSNVSHMGIILQSRLLIEDTPQDGMFNQIIESTSLNGFSGVSISRLSDRIDTYQGEIWWLPLGKTREDLNFKTFYDFLLHQNRKEYDLPQAINSALDTLDNIPLIGRATHNVEDFSKFFCSELAAAGLEAGGAINRLNASEVTPIDLCRFNIYQKDYFQLKGGKKLIGGFNTLNPEGWGE